VAELRLRDDRIALRRWREADAPAVHAACQDPEILRWIPVIPRPYTLEHARAFVTGASGFGPHQFAMLLDDRIVGSIGLQESTTRSAVLGYWCVPEVRGRGIATRALRLLTRYGFEELGLERLELTVDPDNVASQRVAEKAGFTREGVLRSHTLHPDGRRRDAILYSRLPADP
jgi:RimJ/RimL family protein N-acetyltransferase